MTTARYGFARRCPRYGLALGVFFALLASLLRPGSAHAQSQTTQQDGELRLRVDARKKLGSGLRLILSPELRTDGWNPDRYLIQLGLRYKPFDYLAIRTAYRFGVEEKKDGLEPANRVFLEATGHLPLGDFRASLRVRYQDSFGPDSQSKHRLRYRPAFSYQPIKRVKTEVSAEAFQDLRTAHFQKMRYAIGAEWTFYKKKKTLRQGVGLEYRLDYYLEEYRNTHIVLLGYSLLF